jgi:hypothetical protein
MLLPTLTSLRPLRHQRRLSNAALCPILDTMDRVVQTERGIEKTENLARRVRERTVYENRLRGADQSTGIFSVRAFCSRVSCTRADIVLFLSSISS